MLVVKQGIYRDIPEHKLPEYKEKGYKPVSKEAPKKDGKAQKDGGK